MNQPQPSRRIVFQGLSALGIAAVLAGCGGEERPQPQASEPSVPSTSDPSSPSQSAPGKKLTKGAPADALATTAEIPVGGGIVLTDARLVVTQPRRGEFKAFSAVCTHQGETVGQVEDNTITCLFHGSQYDAATGNVTTGPATVGLSPVRIAVRGGSIVRV